MSNMTNVLEAHLGGHVLGASTFSKPSSLYVGLITSVTDAEAGSVTEVGTSDYARVQANPDTGWNNPSGSVWENANKLTFPDPTNDWGQITHVGIWTDTIANGGGELWFVIALANSQTINAGDPAPFFNAGELQITWD